jgi:hypothetical protein
MINISRYGPWEGDNVMKLKTLFTITAAFFIINAPIALLFPGTQSSLYGVTTGPGANYMAQWAGLGSITVALIAWFARNLAESETRRRIVLTLMIYFTLGVILSVLGVFSGVMSAMGWSLLIIYLLFALGYAYFLLKKPSNN